MQSFISNGHDVISPNNNKHFEMLKNEKYAYIYEKTAAEYFISENCAFTIAPLPLEAIQYSIGLQLNSVYTDHITEM